MQRSMTHAKEHDSYGQGLAYNSLPVQFRREPRKIDSSMHQNFAVALFKALRTDQCKSA